MEYLVEFLLQESSQGNQSRRWPEMIRIGLTSFKEHDKLTGKRITLFMNMQGFYLSGIRYCLLWNSRKSSVENWISEVPESFRFVVKVYQGISGQGDWKPYYQTEEEMIAHF